MIGGPIKKDKVFFFVDYQGTRTVEGITSPETSVPSLQDRTGNVSDIASTLTGTVSGTYTAKLLTQELGYVVSQGEPYYTPGCAITSNCVFPDAVIPTRAWSAPAANLLKYIPAPNMGTNLFSTSAYQETVRDDKGGVRIDANTRFLGQLSGYYFVDNYRLDNPYPGGQGGASIPGFDALTISQAQMFTIGDTKVLWRRDRERVSCWLSAQCEQHRRAAWWSGSQRLQSQGLPWTGCVGIAGHRGAGAAI